MQRDLRDKIPSAELRLAEPFIKSFEDALDAAEFHYERPVYQEYCDQFRAIIIKIRAAMNAPEDEEFSLSPEELQFLKGGARKIMDQFQADAKNNIAATNDETTKQRIDDEMHDLKRASFGVLSSLAQTFSKIFTDNLAAKAAITR